MLFSDKKWQKYNYVAAKSIKLKYSKVFMMAAFMRTKRIGSKKKKF